MTLPWTRVDATAVPAATNADRVIPSAGEPPPPVRNRLQPEPSPLETTGTGLRKCEVCGNEYDKTFEILRGGRSHVFDCFECAIHALAPTCAHCGCRIVGHGMEGDGAMFCCAHCAKARGVADLEDRSRA